MISNSESQVGVFPWTAVVDEPVEGMPGVTIRVLLGPSVGARQFAMRLFEVLPGAEIPRHNHWYEQEMFVLQGLGRCDAVDGTHELAAGSVVWIAPDEPHAFANVGDEVLRFICCVPLRQPNAQEEAH